MVNKGTYKVIDDFNGGPPPMDESWWEAVLTEGETVATQPESFETKSGKRELRFPPKAPPAETQDVEWGYALRLYEQDSICTLEVTGFNRGGLLVCGEQLHGFVPISHLVAMTGEKSDEEQRHVMASYVDKFLDLKIIECDPDRGRIVFSERAAQATPGSRVELLRDLEPGQRIRGTVTNITDFGVFIDLGGVEGLVHVSEISWGRVRHPSDVVEYEQEVEVYVINVDQERSRVALSMKRLYDNPWETAEERYFPGQITEATITSIVPFGAFARLEEGLDGLIHISEMNTVSEDIPVEELVFEGQQVKVRVLHVDASRQRLGLSLLTEE